MGIVGNLRTMQLDELLQWLSQSKKSGSERRRILRACAKLRSGASAYGKV